MLASLVDDLEAAFDKLTAAFADPSLLRFTDVRAEMERLERVANKKAFADAAFAHICERDGAGAAVGANYANTYLERALDISPGEAHSRLSRGRDLFGPEDKEDPGLDLGEPAPPRERERARKNSQEVSAEKQTIIDRALRQLTRKARHRRAAIHRDALREATTRSPQDLKKYVKRLVDRANAEFRPRRDPNAGYDQRTVRAGHEKADGTRDVTLTMTAGHYALFKALLDADSGPGSNVPADAGTDARLPGQRKFDQLWNILNQYEQGRQAANRGAASVVLSITLDDIAQADWNTKFPTNTGVEVDCFDLVRLGMAGAADFVLQIDRVTGVPLSLGRTRLASVEQRIALLALQGVCAWTGCDAPMSETEAHHILAYIRGGRTDLLNLAGLCRTHHRCNNDNRDGAGNKGYLDRNPRTGRLGVVPAGGGHMETNETLGFHSSAWARIRSIDFGTETGQDPDPPLFTPPPPRRVRESPPRTASSGGRKTPGPQPAGAPGSPPGRSSPEG
ncbi:HNH endonuclease signature motif containing protein [Corynebacterium sp. UBA2622]|uniref:HNH endonuclease signature motif containing protein n=1 Tax=Corynebacterium sp. UBA2622 TaxID=1946393 RepID=UPI0025C1DA85|nr:HNH endonuclease signature motif containing protein [Corynebacterium sp. UBA2622]